MHHYSHFLTWLPGTTPSQTRWTAPQWLGQPVCCNIMKMTSSLLPNERPQVRYKRALIDLLAFSPQQGVPPS